MVEESQLWWELAQQNANHIATLNREMGGVLNALSWIRGLIFAHLAAMGGLFVVGIRNIYWTKKNGKK